jgi:hypothetical protein
LLCVPGGHSAQQLADQYQPLHITVLPRIDRPAREL